MKKAITLNKKEGETPLEALENFRKKNKKYQGVKMTYAGRLDPMASGLLLLLAEEETKNKEKYLTLDKMYSFKVLFGFATDTHDILGKVTKAHDAFVDKQKLEKGIKNNIKNFLGKTKQKYPMYSSKTIGGKPLFAYARAGKMVNAPEREVFVEKLKFGKITKISNKKLLENIESRINKVKGDFRQKEILKIWKKNLRYAQQEFYIANFEMKCSSGTYVRVLANSLGKRVGIPAIAFYIKRTRIGKYMI